MADKVVYTVITDNYDALKPPAVVDDDIDYIVYSDNPALEMVGPWQLRPLMTKLRNPRVTSRWPKLLPHRHLPDYRASLWIDATVQISASLSDLIDALSARTALAFFPHSARNCIYEEAAVVSASRYEHPEIVDLHMAYYRSRGYPANNGLVEGTVIFRRHGEPDVIAAMEDWWRQIEVFSQRDQLSANYVFWKHRLSYEQLPGSVYDNPWMRRILRAETRLQIDGDVDTDELAWLRAAAIRAQAKLNATTAELNATTRRMDSLKAENRRLGLQTETLEREREALERERQAIASSIDAIRTSRSWRMTAPFRKAKTLLTG